MITPTLGPPSDRTFMSHPVNEMLACTLVRDVQKFWSADAP